MRPFVAHELFGCSQHFQRRLHRHQLPAGWNRRAGLLCLGGGFRGGPFFPAMFVGAGIGAVVTALAPSVGEGAVAAGLTASIVYLARPRWAATVVIGAALGLLAGGAALVPLGVAAAVVTRALPARPVPPAPVHATTATP